MINRTVLVGRLTKDVEVKKTGSGTSMARFTLACDRNKRKEDQESKADFIGCLAWSQSADFLGQYGKKGMLIGVDGRIQTGSYEKNGQTVYTTEVVADTVRILERKEKKEARPVATDSHSLGSYADEVSAGFGTDADPYMQDGQEWDPPF